MDTITQNIIQCYYYIAWFATIFFVVKLIIFTVFGAGDSEVSADFNSEIDTDASFNFISLQSILAFLMGFGWMGYSALKALKMTQLATLGSAFGVGLVFMLGSAYLMFVVKKLEKTVKKDKNTAVGKIGKAYSNFEPKGQGQIEIEINGQLTVTQAVNKSEQAIKAFDTIIVTNIENDILYIQKQ